MLSRRPKPQSRQPGQAQARTPHPYLVAGICAALVIATFAAFRGVSSFGFLHYDDEAYITGNAQVQKGLTAESAAWAFRSTECANWHPVTWLSHMVDIQLFGLDAGKHHRTNLIIHAINAVLLFLLLLRMTGGLFRSAFVAALFAIHPLRVQSVAWIAERKDVLSALFWLLALAAWLGFLKSRNPGRYILVLALFAIGLMAKPMLVTFPFTLLLLDFWPLRRLELPLRSSPWKQRGLLIEKIPLFVLSGASCVITFIAQSRGGAVPGVEQLSIAGRLANSSLAYAGYLGKIFWPSPLAVFYPHPRTGYSQWMVAGALLLLAGLTMVAWALRRRMPFLAAGWLWYLGTLVPVIGLVQVGGQAMADRYTYLPAIGISVMLAWGLAELVKENRPARYAVGALGVIWLAALIGATRTQTGFWASDMALYEHAVAVTSGNWLMHKSLGNLYYRQGKVDQAMAHFNEALRIEPKYAEAHNDLGTALAARGDQDAALMHFRQALRSNPDLAEACINLGIALARQGKLSEALGYLQRAVRIDPMNADAQTGLGGALTAMGRYGEAVGPYQQALRIRPHSAQAWNDMGLAFGRADRLPDATRCFQKALEIDPENADAHSNLGIALHRQDRIPEAIQQFQESLRIRPGFAQAQAGLQAARQALGQQP